MPDWAEHVRQRLSSLRLSPAREHEIVEELSQHLEDRWRELITGGMPEDDATRMALADFSERNFLVRYMAPLQQAQVAAPVIPGAASGQIFSGFWQDLRYAKRTLQKHAVLSFAAVLTLALGIGANTAIFSVVESVLLRPLPYPEEGRIVRVKPTIYPSRGNDTDRGASFSPRGYWHFANNNRSFEKFGGYRVLDDTAPLTGDGPPVLVDLAVMTLSAFEALGVMPERGRLPLPEEDAPGGARVALISHDLWVYRYGSDPSILGRTVHVLGLPHVVIGVMPSGYDFPTPKIDVWRPLQLNPASQNFSGHNIRAIARLKPDTSINAAIDDSQSLIARFEEAGYGPSWLKEVFDGGAIVRPLREEIVGDARAPLLIVLGAVGFVLLIACSNVANLLLVQAEGRRQENAVRIAIGCSRLRLARYMFMESAMLTLMGAVAGVLLAYLGTRALVAIGPESIPRLDEISINGTALAFTGLVSALAGLFFGVLPAMRTSPAPMTEIRDGGRSATYNRRRRGTGNALVMAQAALAFVLVIGSGLMVRSFNALRSVDPGFDAEGVLTFQLFPLPSKYSGHEEAAQLYQHLIGRLEALPGVINASAIDTLPLTGDDNGFGAVIEEFPPIEGGLAPAFKVRRITPRYFETMGIPVVEGRAFTQDDHRLPSVIISKSVKTRYWPATSAIGKRITLGRLAAQVVGVVGDVHDASLDQPPDQFLYFPILDPAGGGVRGMAMTATVRTTVEPLAVMNAVRTAIAGLDGDLPIEQVRSMERVLADSMSRTSFLMSVLGIAAVIALVLGAVGIYGVLSYVVSQRTTEIGIRLALGGSPSAVRRMIIGYGLRLAGIGVAIGLVAAVALAGVMKGQLYGVSPVDPPTLIGASAIFLAVAFLASLLPAVRAAGTAPAGALRASR